MSRSEKEDMTRSKVELHIHLDCSMRISTVWDLLQKKKLYPQFKTLEELQEACRIVKPSTLANFLKPCAILISAVSGDLEAIERVAYELCEDQAKEGVIYCEIRCCPLLWRTDSLTAEQIVQHVLKGVNRGQQDFEIKVRLILCCLRNYPEWSEEILSLCHKFQNDGVVGIDIAGDEAMRVASPGDIIVFQKAKELGIHRTVHAGEAGPAENVRKAICEMHAERIGHGYHVLSDSSIYGEVLKSGIHIEVCPYSSYLTGSVSRSEKHPVLRFAADNASFSINKDDTALIGKTLDEEYDLLRELGLKEYHFARANFNAAMSSFLPDEEKRELIAKLKKVYGVPDI